MNENMALFDRDKGELIPLLYNVGDKIMGYDDVGIDMLVGGTIIEVRQSTSHLCDNHYNVELEPEVVVGACKGTWWINGKGIKPFKQDVWNNAVKHWKEYIRLKEKSHLERVRMFKALKEENDEIEEEALLKEINTRCR
jgi:hypothetical protein